MKSDAAARRGHAKQNTTRLQKNGFFLQIKSKKKRAGGRAHLRLLPPDGELSGEGRLDVGEVSGQDRVAPAALHDRQKIHCRRPGHVRRVVLEKHVEHLSHTTGSGERKIDRRVKKHPFRMLLTGVHRK